MILPVSCPCLTCTSAVYHSSFISALSVLHPQLQAVIKMQASRSSKSGPIFLVQFHCFCFKLSLSLASLEVIVQITSFSLLPLFSVDLSLTQCHHNIILILPQQWAHCYLPFIPHQSGSTTSHTGIPTSPYPHI